MMNAGQLERQIRDLQQAVSALSAQVAGIRPRTASIGSTAPVLMARTYDDGAYPTSGANTFPATFIDPSYNDARGTQSLSAVERNTANIINVHCIPGTFIPAGTAVPIVEIAGQYYTWYAGSGSGGDTDAGAFVRIKATTGSPSACGTVNRVVSTCHYSGVVVTLDSSPNFCSDPWDEGTSVWIADADRCSPRTSLEFNDVYLARKVADSFQPSSGLGLRPLYILRSNETASSDVAILRIEDDTATAACADAAQISSECVYKAKLQSVSLAGATMCSPFTDGADVYAFKVSGCCTAKVKEDERYIALKVGEYTSAGDSATTRDIYAITGSFCPDSASVPRIGIANGRINAGSSGSVKYAEGANPSSIAITASTVTVYNPFNGDILDGTRVEIEQMELQDVGLSTFTSHWCICPMHQMYRGKTAATITAGSSGTVNIWNGTATGQSVTAYHNWCDGGVDIASGTEVFIQWMPLERQWHITGVEC